MRLRPDLVLVALPPRERLTTAAGVTVLPAPGLIVDVTGVVVDTGARVDEVQVGDRVLFGADVGEEVRVDDWPCLVLRASDLDAVIEGTHARRRRARSPGRATAGDAHRHPAGAAAADTRRG